MAKLIIEGQILGVREGIYRQTEYRKIDIYDRETGEVLKLSLAQKAEVPQMLVMGKFIIDLKTSNFEGNMKLKAMSIIPYKKGE